MIVVIAPYSPPSLGADTHLGASRKIEGVIQLLSEIDPDIILVNSAHNEPVRSEAKIEDLNIGSVIVKQISLATYKNRKWGKFRNLLDAHFIAKRLLNLGRPNLVWAYNAYAFESLLSLYLKRLSSCPFVMEFEDWHFSRRSLLNPKPYVDYFVWRAARHVYDHFFAVNVNLANKLKKSSGSVRLLPGLVSRELIQIADSRKPFSDATVRVGYFGGLSFEKGASLILESIPFLPEGYQFCVTGAGELECEFRKAMGEYPGKLKFYGAVSNGQMYEVMSKCDVVLNPHSLISQMSDGVFPFKVIEGVASGRLVISTTLPDPGIDGVLDGVSYFDGSSSSLVEMILESRKNYDLNVENILSSSNVARDYCGYDSLKEIFSDIYDSTEDMALEEGI